MKDNKRNIDQFFQEELGGYTEAPPALVWENLEKRLDDKSSKKPKMFWWLYLLVAAVLVGGSIAAYFHFSNNKTTSSFDNLSVKNISKSNTDNTLGLAQPSNSELNIDEKLNALNGDEKNMGQQNALGTNSADHSGFSANSKSINNPNINSESKKGQGGNARRNNTANPSNFNSKNTANNHSRSSVSDNNISTQSNSTSTNSDSVNSQKSINNSKSKLKGGEVVNGVNDRSGAASSGNSLSGNNSVGDATASAKNKKADKNANSNQQDSDYKNALNEKSKSSVKSKTSATEDATSVGKNIAKAKNILAEGKNSKGQPINPKPAIESKPPFQAPKVEKFAPKKQQNISSPKDNANYLMVTPADDDDNELANEEAAKEKKSDFELDQAAKDKLKNIAAPTAKKQNSAKNVLAAKKAETNDGEEEDDQEGEEKNQDEGPDSPDQEKPSNPSSSGGGGGGGGPTKKEKIRKSLNLALGVKAGYETGYQNLTARKNVASIFLEVALSNRLNFIMQPSLKFGKLSRQISGEFNDTFFNAGDVNRERLNELDTFGKPTGFSKYYFSQNIDSLKQTTSSTNKLMEIEVPFLFRYKVDKNFSVLAGINFLFGRTLGFNSSENRFSSTNLRDSVSKVFDTVSPVTPGRFLAPGISGKSDIPANYASPTSPVRFGYTIGLTYAFKEKLMIDLLIQQNLSGTSSLTNDEVRKVFEQPYVRLSMGYVLFGKTKK